MWTTRVSPGTRGRKPCICRSPTRTGRQFTFTASSKGGIAAIAHLAGLYGRRIRDNPHELPIVALGVGSYRHRNKASARSWFQSSTLSAGSTARPCRVPRRMLTTGPWSDYNGRSSAPAADTPSSRVMPGERCSARRAALPEHLHYDGHGHRSRVYPAGFRARDDEPRLHFIPR